ncbi:MAG: hypothetical protein AAF605_03225 [Myxococcota bacterium]
MQDNVVNITPKLVSHSTVGHYFTTLGKIPRLPVNKEPAPAPVADNRWPFMTVSGYFSAPVQQRAVEDVVLVKTGGVCSRSLGRLENVFADFGGAS